MSAAELKLRSHSFLFENLDRIPGGIRWLFFIFERALEIHLGQSIVGIELEELRQENFRLGEIAFAKFSEASLVGLEAVEKFLIPLTFLRADQGRDLHGFGFAFYLDEGHAAQVELVLNQISGPGADQNINRIGSSESLETGREVDRVADHRRVGLFLGADVANEDIAVVDPDPNMKRRDVLRCPLRI